MEPTALITAILAVFTAAGGGAWKLIDRADKKRERREVAVEELLKERVASLEAENRTLRADNVQIAAGAEKQRRKDKRYTSRVKAAAGKWREQLLVNDLQPDPKDWPVEDENDDTE
ncbi:hypothetical protein [Paenarthrobacter nitroguajacolicus]|uniref:hypothetical protein n=1 Tax=Paenarthrobacter nitroguajacolicus TaxID=211146 RepID=UPI0015B99AB2|nr:hypothetical protein [Paenarthrobacter nitroguajacolicus]NWL32983.1 hypothetical protein [Paenarthrobacter nitroguajacolicus]